MTALYLGTSGFAYADWKPLFYPADVAQSRFLQHYSSRLSSVEINYTFNRFPTDALLTGWASKVPDGFTFSLKAPRRISHEKRLRECGDEIERLVVPARTLGHRLGVILIQTPPTLPAEAGVLKDFVAAWPRDIRVAFEFRHDSWNTAEVAGILRDGGCAWVAAEDDSSHARLVDTAASFAYLRLRKNAYDDAALEDWGRRITSMMEADTGVFGYLRHDADGSNALAAEKLGEALSVETPGKPSETATTASPEPPPSS